MLATKVNYELKMRKGHDKSEGQSYDDLDPRLFLQHGGCVVCEGVSVCVGVCVCGGGVIFLETSI